MQITAIHSGAVSGQTATTNTPSPKLVRAAHEFEGQMMEELLKPMMNSSDPLTGDDEQSGSGGTLGEFATEALGKALSQQGGFGIADGIIKELSHQELSHTGTDSGNGNHRGKVTKNLHRDTAIRASE